MQVLRALFALLVAREFSCTPDALAQNRSRRKAGKRALSPCKRGLSPSPDPTPPRARHFSPARRWAVSRAALNCAARLNPAASRQMRKRIPRAWLPFWSRAMCGAGAGTPRPLRDLWALSRDRRLRRYDSRRRRARHRRWRSFCVELSCAGHPLSGGTGR